MPTRPLETLPADATVSASVPDAEPARVEIEMIAGPRASPLRLDTRPGKPPLLWAATGGDAVRWAAVNRDVLRAVVAELGVVLVRGLGLHDVAGTQAVLRCLGEPMPEREAFAPRHHYAPGIYSATRWPQGQAMGMHHELSYALEFPRLLMFVCLIASAGGGATPVADSPTVLHALPDALVARFERVGWLLVRNYNEDLGVSVAVAFGTDDRAAIERYCRANAIDFEWRPDGTLRTRQRRAAILAHPLDGSRCWFNQVAFLNRWTIDPEVRDHLIGEFGEDGLPFDTRFGDGEPIDPQVVETIHQVYEASTAREAWQAGDLMLVDNIRTAHAREPFEGPREVVAVMADRLRAVDRAQPIRSHPAGGEA